MSIDKLYEYYLLHWEGSGWCNGPTNNQRWIKESPYDKDQFENYIRAGLTGNQFYKMFRERWYDLAIIDIRDNKLNELICL